MAASALSSASASGSTSRIAVHASHDFYDEEALRVLGGSDLCSAAARTDACNPADRVLPLPSEAISKDGEDEESPPTLVSGVLVGHGAAGKSAARKRLAVANQGLVEIGGIVNCCTMGYEVVDGVDLLRFDVAGVEKAELAAAKGEKSKWNDKRLGEFNKAVHKALPPAVGTDQPPLDNKARGRKDKTAKKKSAASASDEIAPDPAQKVFADRREEVGPVLAHFLPFFHFLDRKIDCDGQSVLLHCQAGAHRAGAAGIAAVMWRENLRYDDALAWVQSRRPIVDPTQPGRSGERSLQDMLRELDRDLARFRAGGRS